VYVNLSHDHIALEETLIYPQARANRAAELAKRQAG
jgi:hemerythrin-like domain-containing protein